MLSLQFEILAHYSSAYLGDFLEGDFSDPQVRRAIGGLIVGGYLATNPVDNGYLLAPTKKTLSLAPMLGKKDFAAFMEMLNSAKPGSFEYNLDTPPASPAPGDPEELRRVTDKLWQNSASLINPAATLMNTAPATTVDVAKVQLDILWQLLVRPYTGLNYQPFGIEYETFAVAIVEMLNRGHVSYGLNDSERPRQYTITHSGRAALADAVASMPLGGIETLLLDDLKLKILTHYVMFPTVILRAEGLGIPVNVMDAAMGRLLLDGLLTWNSRFPDDPTIPVPYVVTEKGAAALKAKPDEVSEKSASDELKADLIVESTRGDALAELKLAILRHHLIQPDGRITAELFGVDDYQMDAATGGLFREGLLAWFPAFCEDPKVPTPYGLTLRGKNVLNEADQSGTTPALLRQHVLGDGGYKITGRFGGKGVVAEVKEDKLVEMDANVTRLVRLTMLKHYAGSPKFDFPASPIIHRDVASAAFNTLVLNGLLAFDENALPNDRSQVLYRITEKGREELTKAEAGGFTTTIFNSLIGGSTLAPSDVQFGDQVTREVQKDMAKSSSIFDLFVTPAKEGVPLKEAVGVTKEEVAAANAYVDRFIERHGIKGVDEEKMMAEMSAQTLRAIKLRVLKHYATISSSDYVPVGSLHSELFRDGLLAANDKAVHGDLTYPAFVITEKGLATLMEAGPNAGETFVIDSLTSEAQTADAGNLGSKTWTAEQLRSLIGLRILRHYATNPEVDFLSGRNVVSPKLITSVTTDLVTEEYLADNPLVVQSDRIHPSYVITEKGREFLEEAGPDSGDMLLIDSITGKASTCEFSITQSDAKEGPVDGPDDSAEDNAVVGKIDTWNRIYTTTSGAFLAAVRTKTLGQDLFIPTLDQVVDITQPIKWVWTDEAMAASLLGFAMYLNPHLGDLDEINQLVVNLITECIEEHKGDTSRYTVSHHGLTLTYYTDNLTGDALTIAVNLDMAALFDNARRHLGDIDLEEARAFFQDNRVPVLTTKQPNA